MEWVDDSLFDDTPQEFIDSSWCMSLAHMIHATSLTEEQKRLYLSEIEEGITQERAYEIKEIIEQNTPCPIDSGRNYSQTDILNKLKGYE